MKAAWKTDFSLFTSNAANQGTARWFKRKEVQETEEHVREESKEDDRVVGSFLKTLPDSSTKITV